MNYNFTEIVNFANIVKLNYIEETKDSIILFLLDDHNNKVFSISYDDEFSRYHVIDVLESRTGVLRADSYETHHEVLWFIIEHCENASATANPYLYNIHILTEIFRSYYTKINFYYHSAFGEQVSWKCESDSLPNLSLNYYLNTGEIFYTIGGFVSDCKIYEDFFELKDELVAKMCKFTESQNDLENILKNLTMSYVLYDNIIESGKSIYKMFLPVWYIKDGLYVDVYWDHEQCAYIVECEDDSQHWYTCENRDVLIETITAIYEGKHLSNQNIKDFTHKIADNYTIDSQIDIAIEEMSELIKELIKYKRTYRQDDIPGKYDFSTIIEEYTDVEIMLEQLKYLFKLSEESIKQSKSEKLRRQFNRISQIGGEKTHE